MTDDLWQEVDKIEGWLSRDEAEQLYNLCSGVWCEIGSWKGRSTRVLAEKSHGYAIDWFKGNSETEGADTYQEFMQNVGDFRIVAPKKRMEDSTNYVIEPVQLLFLDGEHTYKATKLAFELYEPKVIPGGYIVLHDVNGYRGSPSTFPGVTKFADELMQDTRFKFVADVNRNRAFQKL